MKTKKCPICGSLTHTKAFCWQIAKKRIRPYRLRTKLTRDQTKAKWRLANPPDSDGHWRCYLQISPMCLRILDESTLTLDHVKPKGSHRDLKYEIDNLKPCCAPCNTLKGSRSLDSIIGETAIGFLD